MPQKKPYTYEQFTAIRRYGSQPPLAFSPDGSWLAYTVNTSGQFNLWKQPTAGGFAHQLTLYSDNAVRSAAWSPDGKWIAFIADHHGDENSQVYLMPAEGGQPQKLTEVDDAQHFIDPSSWSPNGRYLALYSNDRGDHTNMDVILYDLKTGEKRRLVQGSALYAFGGWSPDGKRMVAVDVKSNTNSDFYLVDVKTGGSKLLTEHDGQVKYFPGPWKRDGSGFYFVTDEGREFSGLAFYDVRKYEWRWVETPDWDVEFVSGSRDGRFLAWVVNEHGYSRLYVRNLKTGKLVKLPELPNGTIAALEFSPNGDKIALMTNTPTHCGEIYVLDLPKRKLTQITHSMLGGIDERDLAEPKLVHFTSFDGRQIPAYLYKPKGVSASKQCPIVLSIHGGPEAQERPMYIYSGVYQYWISRGIAVLAPNIRGSTGYGKTYQKLIHRDWGGNELKDIEAAAKYMQSLNWADSKRMAVFGGSFGGFATLSAVSRLPDYWAAAVDLVGPANLLTFVKAVPPHWRRFMDEWVGNPETDKDLLVERSPITYVDQIKAPLFIIQGAKDPRVVKSESDQMVEKLRARGVDVRYDVYEDEGHGFTKRENELKAWRTAAEFMEKYLL